jgi:hypothetical protein
VDVVAKPPSGEVRGRGNVVGLGAVASVGDDKVLDGVVRQPRPSQNVINRSTAIEPVAAVETSDCLATRPTAASAT